MKRIAREFVVEYCRGLIGIPYRHQGRSANGLDCVGPLVLLASEIGIDITDDLRYGYSPDNYRLSSELRSGLDKIRIKDIMPGSIVLMKIKVMPQHVGIITNHPSGQLGLLHASNITGMVTEHVLSRPWQKRIFEAFDFKGII